MKFPNLSKKLFGLILAVIVLIATFYLLLSSAFADELEEISKQIEELRKSREMSITATAPLESQLAQLNAKLQSIQNQIDGVATKISQKEAELKKLESEITQAEIDLKVEKFLLAKTVRASYIRLKSIFPLAILLSVETAQDLARQLAYHQILARQDREIISGITDAILDLNNKKTEAANLKKQLEGQRERLAQVRAATDREAEFFRKEIGEAKKFQQQLTIEISKLTTRQQEILGAKFGTFTTSVGDVPLPDDPAASPAFNPGFSPAYAAFSFGAFTHRNGMSQYGAKGRAEAGQSAEDILRHYYPGANLNKNYSVPGNITVEGFGTIPFEDSYMKRIFEMPNSFPREALKAQAVAARTFAIRYTNGGSRPICATQSCQVYKPENKGGAWEEVVNETRGWVLEGGPNAQYSSTTGGYLNNSGWDTKCGSQSCWTPDAYEKLAASPWFYKGWYTQSYFIGSATCGRSHPWLNQADFSDILNAWIVWQQGNDDDRKRITPVDTACWGGSPYSVDEMKNKASNFGGAVTSITAASVSYSTNGATAQVIINTNRGSFTISGDNFKTIFNLRAPGYIALRSPLFNIERK